MGMLKEFRDFALKGNVIDLAVGVIIGTAFTAIVSSLVDDVITPLLLKPALEAAQISDLENLKVGAIKYGKFISAVIKFIIIAFILFWIVKGAKGIRKKEETAAPPAPSTTEKLLMEIRDSLKK